ncbi:MAG: twin-arginine translocase TatA/TatE family subunit [Clostridiales bacterium]|nr:twin-arginine translocase TatA/TatE family subunit [Clostridiales bacterium]
MRLGTMEILLILVLALVIFGGGKIAGVGKALGQSIREFKNEVKSDDKAEEKVEKTDADSEKKGE